MILNFLSKMYVIYQYLDMYFTYVFQPTQMVSKHTKTDFEIQKPFSGKAGFANRRFAIL